MSKKRLTNKDGEVRELSGDDFRRARRLKEAHPEIIAAFKRGPGRPPAARTKEQVSLRLSPEVLDYFREAGPGWQTRIDQALRDFVDQR